MLKRCWFSLDLPTSVNKHSLMKFNKSRYRSSLTDSLFPTAWLFPGRIDRKIEFPLPDEKTKRRIFSIHTSRMTVADDVTLDELILAKDDLSGADIKVRGKEPCLCVAATGVYIYVQIAHYVSRPANGFS